MSDHKGHEVQYTANEGGMYRLFCHTCSFFLDLFTYIPKTLMKFIWS